MPFSFFLEMDASQGFIKKDIDACNVSLSWARACDAIRAVFFLSRSIRKERDAWLCFPGLGMLLALTGWSIRYLGPDERSMLMLVDKAMTALGRQPRKDNDALSQDSWRESTPGFRCKAIAGQEDALQLYASVHEDCTFFFPEFATSNVNATMGFSFPEELPGIVAAGSVCVVLGNDDGTVIPPWLGGEDQGPGREHPIKLIKGAVNTRTRLDTIASKIMLFNLIDDNFRVDTT